LAIDDRRSQIAMHYHLSVPPLIVSIQRLSPTATLPAYATPGAAGMDLAAAIDQALVLAPGQTALVPCGFAIALPHGFEAQIRPRSGLAAKHGVTVLNAPGTIDCDYRGEVKAILINHGSEPFTVTPGMRVAQMVVAAVEQVVWAPADALPDTTRAAGGFGHTGH
jgi:dUTP pyrophosphatase